MRKLLTLNPFTVIFAALAALLWPFVLIGLLGISSFGSSIGVLPIGGIIMVDSTLGACPTAFTEVTTARGRYIVGVPSAGTLSGTVDTALTDLQAKAAGAHTHTEMAYTTGAGQGITAGASNATPSVLTTTIQTASTGTGTSAAPYIQLMLCRRLT